MSSTVTNNHYSVIIIGSGLAGYNLAKEFRKLDKEASLLILTKDDGHNYSKPMLSTGFTKGKAADDLSMADPVKMADQLGALIRNFTVVKSIDTDAKTIALDGEELSYGKLVLATGASCNKLSFPGSDGKRVVSINSLMDYREFRSQLGEQQHVLIMGAGLIGCEYANDLIEGGHSVTIVDPSATALNGLIPEPAGNALVAGLEQAGANFIFGDYVKEISDPTASSQTDHPAQTLTARTNQGQEITADIVISAVGLHPEIELAKQANIDCDHGILVNRALETSISDVYALGDCAQVDGKVLLYVLPLMSCARALAKTLNGERCEVKYGVMPVATKTPACPVVVSPPANSDGEWYFEEDGINIKGLYKQEDQLHGFVLTGTYVSEKQALAKTTTPIHAE